MTDDEFDARYGALASAAQPAAVPHAQMTEEIDNILSDPDTRLSPGAERALRWLRTWTDAPLVLAAATKAAPASQDAEDAARYRYLTLEIGSYCITDAYENSGGVLKAGAADAAIDAARAQQEQKP